MVPLSRHSDIPPEAPGYVRHRDSIHIGFPSWSRRVDCFAGSHLYGEQ